MPRLAVACALAAVSSGALLNGQQPTFRSGLELVRVDVAVTRDGHPVTDLGPGDFVLRDNGVPQKVREVIVERVPLDLTLVLDVSSSVKGEKLARLADAARQLVQGMAADDRVSLVTFSHRVTLRQPPGAGAEAVLRDLGALEASGATALNDAIFSALMQREPNLHRAIAVVFSDGLDNASWLSERQVAGLAARSDEVVHVVAESPYADPPGRRSRPRRPFFDDLTRVTGGRLWWVADANALAGAFVEILSDIRSRYLLVYEPQGVARSGWHTLDVRLTRARGDVTARPGYFRQ